MAGAKFRSAVLPDFGQLYGCRILLDKDGELYAVGQGGELDYQELLNWAIAEYVEQHSSTKEEHQVCIIAAVLGRSKGFAAEAGAYSTVCDLQLLHHRFKLELELRVAAVTCLTLTASGNFELMGYSSGHVNRYPD